MHKGIDLFRNDPDLGERKKSIIFLDIDGVIQPYHSQMRHEYDLDAMIEKLCEKYDPEVVRRGDKYDVAAAYYDWNEIAVGRIAYLCHHMEAYIVMSTGWRQWNDNERFRLFLSFYGLEDYLLDTCENISFEEMEKTQKDSDHYVEEKVVAIRKWIEAHKDDVDRYLVIDDKDMTYEFGTSFLYTDNIITDDDTRFGCYLMGTDNEYKFTKNEIKLDHTRLRFVEKTIGDRKVVFFRTFHRKSKYDTEYNKSKEHRYLIALLRHHFGGDHLKSAKRAGLFVWIQSKREYNDEARRYMQNCGYSRTGKWRTDDYKVLNLYRGISGKDKFIWEENEEIIKAMAEELWNTLT